MAANVTIIEANAAVGDKRTLPPSGIPRRRRPHIGRDRDATSRRLSGLLAFFLMLASLIALYEAAQIPGTSSDSANSSRSIRTIRSFYADLNAYLETGDAGNVSAFLAPGAWSVVPEPGGMGDHSGLMTYLLALRSTLPQLRFTFEHIDAWDDLALASVHISGDTGAPGTLQEFFRVRDGRIVDHWATAPGPALLQPLTVPPVHIELFQPGHLAIAELSFSPGPLDSHSIDGPALVIIQRGQLTLTGNGSSQILNLETGAAVAPGQNENVPVRPGQAICIPEFQALVQNSTSEMTRALVATVVEDPRQQLESVPGEQQPSPPALNDAVLIGEQHVTIYGSATIQPLAFGDRSIPAGTWELEINWAVLGPGASQLLSTEGEWAITHVISGSANRRTVGQDSIGTSTELWNDGTTPALALVMRLHATQ